MAKTVIHTENIEIVKQVKLTIKQRTTLVEMQNNGGKYKSYLSDWTLRVDLVNLQLIEERDGMTAAEKKQAGTAISERWKALPALVKSKDAKGAERLLDEIRDLGRDLEKKAWWLTPNAYEYLLNGRVVITR